jgi:hypothetical protein
MRTVLTSVLLSLLLLPCGLSAGEQLESKLASVEEDIGKIGVQPPPEEKPQFRVLGSLGATYTSNARNLGSHSNSDLLWLPAFEVGYHVPLERGFSLDSFVRLDSVLYTTTNFDRSFWAATGGVYVDHRLKPNWPRVYVGGEAYNFQQYSGNDLLTQAMALRIGFDHGIPFNNGHDLFFYGYDFGQYWTRPGNDARDTHRATAGFMHQFTDKLFAQLFYSFQYSQFLSPSGTERRHAVGLNVIYQINDNWSAALNTGYVTSGSSRSTYEYDAATAGAQVAWHF